MYIYFGHAIRRNLFRILNYTRNTICSVCQHQGIDKCPCVKNALILLDVARRCFRKHRIKITAISIDEYRIKYRLSNIIPLYLLFPSLRGPFPLIIALILRFVSRSKFREHIRYGVFFFCFSSLSLITSFLNLSFVSLLRRYKFKSHARSMIVRI